ncbi:gliding motility-associated C-terminal domain-containing protein, partial [Flavobacterium sp.]
IEVFTSANCTYDASVAITGDVTNEADNCSTGLQATFTDSVVPGQCAGSFIITRTWSLVDACGNAAATQDQIITVVDNTNPVAPTAPAPITAACSAQVPAMISLTAVDNCSGSITVPGVDTINPGSCANSYTVTRTWTFTDACGNSSSVSQIISVNDNVAPTFDQAAPADTAASCDNIPAPAVITATDNCGTANVTMTETTLAGICPSTYTIIRTWTATDACGNVTVPSLVQTINVSDLAPPQIIDPIDPKIAVTCDQIPVAPVLTAADFTDNCSVVGTPVFTETQTVPVDNTYFITRTWTVADACGNTTTITQSIQVSQSTVQVTEVNVPASDEICNDEINGAYDLSIYLPAGTPAGGTWANESNVGVFNGTVLNAFGVAEGTYVFSYSYPTGNCPQKININVPIKECGIVQPCGDIFVFNAFTPNGDGLNEFFNIDNIDDVTCYPTNKVEIYNRWGILVYETKNYDNNTRKFVGISEGRVTVSKNEELPTGTYFYIIEWTTSTGETFTKDGYLYLTR